MLLGGEFGDGGGSGCHEGGGDVVSENCSSAVVRGTTDGDVDGFSGELDCSMFYKVEKS